MMRGPLPDMDIDMDTVMDMEINNDIHIDIDMGCLRAFRPDLT